VDFNKVEKRSPAAAGEELIDHLAAPSARE
jgi:hypothetical protein